MKRRNSISDLPKCRWRSRKHETWPSKISIFKARLLRLETVLTHSTAKLTKASRPHQPPPLLPTNGEFYANHVHRTSTYHPQCAFDVRRTVRGCQQRSRRTARPDARPRVPHEPRSRTRRSS